MIHNVISGIQQESSWPSQQLSTEIDSHQSLDPVAVELSSMHEFKPETEMVHDYVSIKDQIKMPHQRGIKPETGSYPIDVAGDQSDNVRDVQTGSNTVKVEGTDMLDPSDSVMDVQTGSNTIKVEGTDMLDHSDSVMDVQTGSNPIKVEGTDVCAQSDSVRDVQMADMSDQSQVHHAEINDTSVNDVLMVSDDQVNVDMSDQSQVHHAEVNVNDV